MHKFYQQQSLTVQTPTTLQVSVHNKEHEGWQKLHYLDWCFCCCCCFYHYHCRNHHHNHHWPTWQVL